MNRPLVRFSKVFASLSVVAGVCLSAPPEASAQEVVVQPDDAFIATAEPVYYNGVAHYWYRNHWYYRNGRSWAAVNVNFTAGGTANVSAVGPNS
jgi:hypothetical protein